MTPSASTGHPDVLLIGAGIMSATLAVLLKELDPGLKIELHEVLGSAAQERLECMEQCRYRSCGSL